MKALSIRQPWADLIIQGKKTLELRNWTVTHRGPLAIHASQTVDDAACRLHGIDPRHVSAGVLIGIVNLDATIPLDADAFAASTAEHLSTAAFKAPLFGWRLSDPQAFEQPIPYTGRMGLFNVPDRLLTAADQHPLEPVPAQKNAAPDSRRPFELQVHSEPGDNPRLAAYRLGLYQELAAPVSAQPRLSQNAPLQHRLVCELGGLALKSVADAVLEALRLNGYSPTDLNPGRRQPFHLTEESGVRLALIFLAVRPITKAARIEEISRGIRTMTGEELYYWFAKCTAVGVAERAQKALRILLAEE